MTQTWQMVRVGGFVLAATLAFTAGTAFPVEQSEQGPWRTDITATKKRSVRNTWAARNDIVLWLRSRHCSSRSWSLGR